jgi:hypothetical protein
LYLMMMQWAKLQVWQQQRIIQRGLTLHHMTAQQSTVLLLPTTNNSSGGKTNNNSTSTSSNNNNNNNNTNNSSKRRGTLTRSLSQLPLSHLQGISDRVYATRHDLHNHNNNNNNMTPINAMMLLSDPLHYAAAYIRCMKQRRSMVHSTSSYNNHNNNNRNNHNNHNNHHTSQHEVEEVMLLDLLSLLKETVSWDTNVNIVLSSHRILWRHAHTIVSAPYFAPPHSSMTITNATATANATSASASGSAATASANITAMVVTNGGGKPVIGEGDLITAEDLFVFGSLIIEAASSELLFTSSKQVFSMYQGVIHSFLANTLQLMNTTEETLLKQAIAAMSASNNNNNNGGANSNYNNNNRRGNTRLSQAVLPNVETSNNLNAIDPVTGSLIQNVRSKVQQVRSQLISLTEFFSQAASSMQYQHQYQYQQELPAGSSGSGGGFDTGLVSGNAAVAVGGGASGAVSDNNNNANLVSTLLPVSHRLYALAQFNADDEPLPVTMTGNSGTVNESNTVAVTVTVTTNEDQEVRALKDKRQIWRSLANDAQVMLRGLLSAVAELAAMTQQEYPRDAWHAGSKLHLDRNLVYTIYTKNSLA